MNKLISKVVLGVALAGAVTAGSATASLAFGGDRHYYEPSDNGSVWSFYPGYFDNQNPNASDYRAPRAYDSATHQTRTTQRHTARPEYNTDESN